MLYNQLANSGRYGDTQVREVNGEPSHVNDMEAHWIDNMGPLGELATQAIGSGTTNPNTGMKEYWVGQALGLALQAAPGIYSMLNPGSNDSSNLETNMQPWTENTQFIQNQAHQLIDPNSALNVNQEKHLKQNALDSLAMKNMLTNRNEAQGGFGGYGGIKAQQTEAELTKFNQDFINKLLENHQTNYATGMGLLGNVGGDLREFGTMQTNRDMSMLPQNWGDILSNFGSGMFDFFSNPGSEKVS